MAVSGKGFTFGARFRKSEMPKFKRERRENLKGFRFKSVMENYLERELPIMSSEIGRLRLTKLSDPEYVRKMARLRELKAKHAELVRLSKAEGLTVHEWNKLDELVAKKARRAKRGVLLKN